MPSTYEYVKTARNKKRLELQALKDNRPCNKCKVSYPHYVLHWHHRNPEEKLFEISRAVRNNIAWNKILKEIEKCDLLCANCHAIVEWSIDRYPSG